MEWLVSFMQDNPLVPVFLTVGAGFWLGRLRFGTFSLGPVAATLLVGVIVGQLHISVPDMVKNIFFLLFLFALGYNVGPQFFRAFKGPGTRMALFAVTAALVCSGLVVGAARLMGYGNGIAAGLFAGSQTVSASLGLLGDTVREMPMDDGERSDMLLVIPACYAVTYLFGTIGTAWFLSNVAPAMMGGLKRVMEDVARIEQKMDTSSRTDTPGIFPARRPVVFRAYEATSDFYDTPKTPQEIQARYARTGIRVVVERARVNGVVCDPTADMRISRGDIIVLGGQSHDMVSLAGPPGPEVADAELLNFSTGRTPVTVSRKGADGMTLDGLRKQPAMERVIVSGVVRSGMRLPVRDGLELHAGDILTLVGWPCDVAEAAGAIGYADPPSDTTDMVFVGLGIAAGCILGSVAIRIDGIPLELGVSVGTLMAGLGMGWLRARRPSFGHIPPAAVWLLDNLGINMFIAVLGLTAGGALMHGLHEAGVLIIAVGAILTLAGLAINILLARHLFRLSPAEVLGCVAGARCCVAAIGAVQDTLHSDVPNLGYTVTYAVANIAMVFSALAVLFLV